MRLAPVYASMVAALLLSACEQDPNASRPTVVQVVDGCKVYRIPASETYSGYVWTTICPDGKASTQTTDGHGGKASHYEEVHVETSTGVVP